MVEDTLNIISGHKFTQFGAQGILWLTTHVEQACGKLFMPSDTYVKTLQKHERMKLH